MEHAFWHARWEEGRIGFHQDDTNALLLEHWSALGCNAERQVFVPLCGKSGDMLWLREQGHPVIGVELNESACEAFFAENDAKAEKALSGAYQRYLCDGIELLCGDVFELDVERLAQVGAVYDRAALVALPPEMRKRYAQMLIELLPAGVTILLVSMEFEGDQGPPFAVLEDEVRMLFESRFQVQRLTEAQDDLQRRDVAYLLTERE